MAEQTLKQAFAAALAASNGIKLDPIAYDLGDSWAFDYGGEEPINGFSPIIVTKATGRLVAFDMPADFERMEKARRVKV